MTFLPCLLGRAGLGLRGFQAAPRCRSRKASYESTVSNPIRAGGEPRNSTGRFQAARYHAPMAGLTESELAERAGTTAGEVRRFADLGLLVEQEGDGGYSPTEVQLIRLMVACEQSGIDAADIARAIEMGQLSLAFTSMSWAQAWGAYTGKTYGDFCRETGLSMELVQRLNEFMGFPRPVPEDPVREDHAEMFPALAAMRGMGVAEPVLTRATRVFGENLRRVAQEGTRLFHSEIEVPLLASGMSERQMRELTGQIGDQIGPLVERLVLWLYRPYQEHFIIQDLVEHIESAMKQAG